MIREKQIADTSSHKYPTVNITKVLFLSDEIQIEQGDAGEYNPHNQNDVLSMSPEQALKLAYTIIDFVEGVE